MICPGCGCVFCFDSDSEPGKAEVKTYCSKQCRKETGRKRRKRDREERAIDRAYAVRKVDRQAWELGLPKTGLPLCPASAKVSYPNAERANLAAATMPNRDLLAYKCPHCPYWHHTST